jgi:hypothetical protein
MATSSPVLKVLAAWKLAVEVKYATIASSQA